MTGIVLWSPTCPSPAWNEHQRLPLEVHVFQELGFPEVPIGRYLNDKSSPKDFLKIPQTLSTYTGINLALQVAAGRLRKALSTSLKTINDKANRSLRKAG